MWSTLGRVLREQLAALPSPLRGAVIGAVLVGVPAAIVGVAVGLHVYAPTSWAAAVELGVPGALLGGFVGLLVGTFVALVHRVRDD